MAGRLASCFGSRLTAALCAATFQPHSSPTSLIHLAGRSPATARDAFFVRYLSSLRRHSARPKAVDIGARARQLQNRRLWTYTLTFGCVAGFVTIVLSNFQDQLVFYITPSDALEKFTSNPAKNRFRLGGLCPRGASCTPAVVARDGVRDH